jgi:hypothetical protein
MAGSMKTEDQTPPTLVTSREPKGPTRAGAPGSAGDQALMDAVCLIIGAWVVLFLLGVSLRGFNI